jgi:hypothetical protein
MIQKAYLSYKKEQRWNCFVDIDLPLWHQVCNLLDNFLYTAMNDTLLAIHSKTHQMHGTYSLEKEEITTFTISAPPPHNT